MSCVDLLAGPTSRYSRNYDYRYTADSCTGKSGNQTITGRSSNSEFNDLDRYEWKANFSYGTVKGMSLCSSTHGGSYLTPGNPSSAEGQYCWCKVTEFAGVEQTLSWIYKDSEVGTDNCHQKCADECSKMLDGGVDYRRIMYYED